LNKSGAIQNLIVTVAKAYPFTVKNIRLLSFKGKKGVWEWDTDKGVKICKKSPASKERPRFQQAAIQHLRANGVLTPAIVPTATGDGFVEQDGACYVVMDAVQGRAPSYDSPEELTAITKALGTFHRASRGFHYPQADQEFALLSKWEEQYRKHLQGFHEFTDLARNRKDAFSQLFLKHVEPFCRHAEQALAVIQGPAYHKWVDKVKKQKNLCHQDFAAGNLRLSKNGMTVIDLDSLTYDLPARDIRKIVNKVMKKKGWSQKTLSLMLAGYHSNNPLNEEEYQVVKADLLYPHLFYGIVSKYYQNREKEWKHEKFVQKLTSIIQTEKAKEPLLAKWNDITRQISEKGGQSGAR
jgi:CotS family spore coat protein